MTWHLSETRALIWRHFGRDQLALARPCLKSVVDRQHFARYHYQEASALLASFAEAHLSDKPLLYAVFGPEAEASSAFETLMVKLGAHTIACVQSVHSIPDILAHVFYYSLGLNFKNPMPERAISAVSVSKLLTPQPQFAELGHALQSLTANGQAPHLAALANHSKHRSIVQPLLNEDATGGRVERHELRFASFAYGSVTYPEVPLRELLEPEYERSSRITITSGEKLNHVLSALAP
jgi:hypothetical protein